MKALRNIFKTLGIVLLVLILLAQTNIGNHGDSISQGDKYLDVGDNKVRYSQIGEGKDILFIHGTPGSVEDWNSLSTRLSKQYRITAFDRLGHGYSSNNGYTYTIEENAELVENIIEILDLQSPMIVGHSYGGSTVAHLLATHYNDELSYMIIDAPLYDYEASTILKLLSLPIIGKTIGLIANYTIAEGQIADGIRSSLTEQSETELQELVNERKAIWLQPKVLYSKAKESKHYQRDLESISKKYNDISADVIVVTGNNNDKTFKVQAEHFSDSVKTDSLVILSNTGHYIQIDQAEKIIGLIQDKLR